MQVAVCIAANYLRLPERHVLTATYAIFTFALLVAMLVLTLQNVCTYLVEIIILMAPLLGSRGIVAADFLITFVTVDEI